jgi:hypothetical protein
MDDKDFNYLDIPNKQFIFFNFKTSHTYQEVKIDIPEDLMAVIHKYLKSHPMRAKLSNKKFDIPFLVNFDSVPINTSDKLTKIMHKIFGQSISSSMLRNIYLTSKYSGVMSDLKKDAAQMSTSVNVAIDNYIKQ